ncbi:hypothetical protein PRIPAC_78410 [Pristionchus pacificus]|uniref:Nuclear receptor n=1 Tax=Pristionchus pacificus TaxID=54126 RepID=A0A2A6CAP7_PRIPA|nr:hypothetical protein PRIPAC_78410 [Pristionchus pacificus]|eukprot:PDM75197.1 nuclear receptor [Pristionchus pacificus]
MADQLCLVCSVHTKHAHLGVLICRACKIFYLRAESRQKPLICRAGTNKCEIVVKCKKCRFEQINRLVKGIGGVRKKEEKSNECYSEPSTSRNETVYDEEREDIPKIARFVCGHSLDARLSLLERVRSSYNTMNLSRRAAELSSLQPTLHPILTFHDAYPLKPATIASLNCTMRILITTLFDFATSAFPEFSSLSLHNKWFLIKNFHQSFWSLESAYRVYTLFPNIPHFHFMSLTTYCSYQSALSFCDIGDKAPHIVEATGRHLRSYLKGDVQKCRNAITNAKVTEKEFLALLILCFWNVDNTSADDSLIPLGVSHRSKILEELQEMYKSEGNSEECATRIGEIMSIVIVMQTCATAMPMKLEMFRLLDIFDDDTTIYQLTKTGMQPPL